MIHMIPAFRCLTSCFFWCLTALVVLAQTSTDEINLANEYFKDGDYEKALVIYEKVVKAYPGTDFYIVRVVDCMVELNRFEEAQEYLNKQIKQNKSELQYWALKGKIVDRQGKTAEAEAIWQDLIQEKLKDLNDFYKVGGYFMSQQKYNWALKTYQQGRIMLKNEEQFTNELAYLYQFEGNFEQSTYEYLKLFLANNSQFPYIKQQILSMTRDTSSAEKVEAALLNFSLRQPNNPQIIELLYDLYMETSNYDEAFIQIRSLDKMKGEMGNGLFKFAQTLQNNKAYETSNEALNYIIKNYTTSPYYIDAIKERAKNFELKAAESIPIDTVSLRQAVENYDALFKQFGRVPQLEEAMYRKARLCVFYLNDLAGATVELDQLESLPIPQIRKAEAKLLLADILVLQQDYSNARIKYTEVEKQFENTQTGARAKFRIARLYYYKGDFEAAKAYLTALKENTSNDIANDAIKLYLTIQDNTGLDSSTTALERFAHAELLIYQKQYAKALSLLDSLAFAYPNHELADDLLWEKANIFLQTNELTKGLDLLDKVIANYSEGIHADDALFKKAEIQEMVYKDKAKAIELYFQLLLKYPASLYKVEARKRIRRLKGESVN
jgi:tetratricopeptide (TPR) repeat protein